MLAPATNNKKYIFSRPWLSYVGVERKMWRILWIIGINLKHVLFWGLFHYDAVDDKTTVDLHADVFLYLPSKFSFILIQRWAWPVGMWYLYLIRSFFVLSSLVLLTLPQEFIWRHVSTEIRTLRINTFTSADLQSCWPRAIFTIYCWWWVMMTQLYPAAPTLQL